MGLPPMDLILLFGVLFSFMIITSFLGFIGIETNWVFVLVLLIVELFLFALLKWANKMKMPNFIQAYISHKLIQPKRILPKKFSLIKQ